MQSQLIGMAMSEAGKLFDSQGGASSGTKQDAMNSAASTAMGLFTQGAGSLMGGGNSGGLGAMGMMSMASKFM